jgi:Inner membrane protein YgaP-like, transmembrane domain
MKQNMKAVDRVLRIAVAGLAVWPALALGPGTSGGIAVLAVAAIFVITGASGFCPLYLAIGRAGHRAGHGVRRPA